MRIPDVRIETAQLASALPSVSLCVRHHLIEIPVPESVKESP